MYKNEIEISDRLILVIISLVVLLVFAGAVKPLVLPVGAVIELDSLLYNIFSAAAMGLFAIAFLVLGLQEKNTLNSIVCYSGSLLLTSIALFGNAIIVVIADLATVYMIALEIGVLIALIFVLLALGIYIIRRSR